MTEILSTEGRPLSKRGLDTRRRLLDAAEAVFGELGYHDASVVRVAQDAGVAAGTFYLYFDSKKAIFDADVRGCAYYATIGGPTAAAPPDNGQITVSGLGSNVNGVDIRTTGANGNDANKPFHLVVLC